MPQIGNCALSHCSLEAYRHTCSRCARPTDAHERTGTARADVMGWPWRRARLLVQAWRERSVKERRGAASVFLAAGAAVDVLPLAPDAPRHEVKLCVDGARDQRDALTTL